MVFAQGFHTFATKKSPISIRADRVRIESFNQPHHRYIQIGLHGLAFSVRHFAPSRLSSDFANSIAGSRNFQRHSGVIQLFRDRYAKKKESFRPACSRDLTLGFAFKGSIACDMNAVLHSPPLVMDSDLDQYFHLSDNSPQESLEGILTWYSGPT